MSLHIVDHPLIGHKMTKIRNKATGPKEFRELVEEVATIICYEATKDAKMCQVEVETPIQKTMGIEIATKYAIVPILRAGLGMLGGVQQFLPMAKVGHIGLYRDPETLYPIEYYTKLPTDVSDREVILVDPMVATGHSVDAAVKIIKGHGVKNIKLFCLVSCPEGIAYLEKKHPDLVIYTAVHDERLNDHGYIVPGLGDAGDRLYGTE